MPTASEYQLIYDPFGRLVRSKNQSSVGTSEYRYNGLGYRIGWHYDVDKDADVDGSDPWFYFAYDERWRMVATYRSTDSDPKEQFAYHGAGLNGHGGSSYIDSVVFRDKDASTAWGSAANALDERRYYCQNWRADVSAVLTDTGKMVESVKYSAYGSPIGIPAGDTDSDGDWDGTDNSTLGSWSAAYDVRADADLNGTVDKIVDTAYADAFTDDQLGRGKLSRSDCSNRKGYAGYEGDSVLGATSTSGTGRYWHVRHRVLDSTLGRWTRRDPLPGTMAHAFFPYLPGRHPLDGTDPRGLIAQDTQCAGGQCSNPHHVPAPRPVQPTYCAGGVCQPPAITPTRPIRPAPPAAPTCYQACRTECAATNSGLSYYSCVAGCYTGCAVDDVMTTPIPFTGGATLDSVTSEVCWYINFLASFDFITCICGLVGIADFIPGAVIADWADCACNVLTTLSRHCTAGGYGGDAAMTFLTLADCFSWTVGPVADIVIDIVLWVGQNYLLYGAFWPAGPAQACANVLTVLGPGPTIPSPPYQPPSISPRP